MSEQPDASMMYELGKQKGYDAAIKDVVAYLEWRNQLLTTDRDSREANDPARNILYDRAVECSSLAGAIERGEAKGTE